MLAVYVLTIKGIFRIITAVEAVDGVKDGYKRLFDRQVNWIQTMRDDIVQATVEDAIGAAMMMFADVPETYHVSVASSLASKPLIGKMFLGEPRGHDIRKKRNATQRDKRAMRSHLHEQSKLDAIDKVSL
jgi:hypothetical protein